MENSVGSMVSLGISTWGARASIIVDPFALAITSSDYSIGVRESLLAVTIDLRSVGEYSTAISEILEVSKEPLIPNITIPVIAEVIFDVNVSDVSISPILSVSSKNAIDGISMDSMDFDAELDTFIDSFDLDILVGNLTTLLTEIAKYGPNLTVGNAPSALKGMFDVVNDAKEFSNALQQFTSIVDDGEIHFHDDVLHST